MFAVAILLIEDQHELHDLLQHDLLTPYNCNNILANGNMLMDIEASSHPLSKCRQLIF